MEPVSNKVDDNVEPEKVDTLTESNDKEKDVVDNSVTEDIQTIETPSAESLQSDKTAAIENEVSLVSENVMEITETIPEINEIENTNKHADEETPMEIDQVETQENSCEAQSEKEDVQSEKEDIQSEKEDTQFEKEDTQTEKEDTSVNKETDKYDDSNENTTVSETNNKLDTIEEESVENVKDTNKDSEQISDNSNKSFENIEGSDKTKDNSNNAEESNKDEETKKTISNDDISIIEDNVGAKETMPQESESSENTHVECIDVDMENEKDVTNDKDEEVEKTEFVQFTQDKESSNLECQPEAEDPFSADNLNVPNDNVEAMEVDSAKKDKSSDESLKPVEEQNTNNDDGPKENDEDNSKEKEIDKDNSKDTNEKDKVAESTDKNDDETSKEKEEKQPNEKTKDSEKDNQTETGSEKSSESKDKSSTDDILPGQDDELCIIPDSTKENKTKDKDVTDNAQSTEKEKEIIIEDKDDKSDKTNEIPENDEANKKTSQSESTEKTNKETGLKVAALTSGTSDIQVNKLPDGPTIVTSDIIDIDDDAKNPDIEEISAKEVCKQCKQEKPCPIKVKVGTKSFNVCSDVCKVAFSNDNNKATDIPSEGVNSKREKRCANCLLIVESWDERNLSWETMEFCNEECLGKFQTKYGSYCRNCNGAVHPVSLGKYCVRFGYDVRQFCCSTCLEEFKKGLKVCSYCQKDISAGTEGFLAPVGDKGQFKDFCTQDCMEKYSRMNSSAPVVVEKKVCGVCQEEKNMHCEVQIDRNPSIPICSEPCFAAFKFVNKVDPDQCSTCKKYFQLPTKKGFVVFYEDEAHTFCNKTCLNVFIITNRKIVPCNWCKVKKYNFDMIKKELKTGQVMMMCSLNCLTLYQVSINAVSARRINCDFCKEYSQAQYHLTMSDATIRNFCSYNCVMKFQAQYTKSPITIPSGDATVPTVSSDPVPTGIPKRAVAPPKPIQPAPASTTDHSTPHAPKKTLPVISSVTSLAAIANGQAQNTVQLTNAQPTLASSGMQPITLQGAHPVIYKQQVVTRPTSPIDIANKMTQCKPQMHTKGVSVRPVPCHQSTQTEGPDRVLIPIPVPIYVPFPVHMYSMPYPVPIPIPIPIPVPVFIPTTRNSAKGIFKEIKRIQEKIPSDPFEAELLMMAEMVATEKKNESDSDSNDDARDDGEVNEGGGADAYSPEGVDSTNAFGDDMLQMALKMATGELEEPAVDIESALTSSTIQTPQRNQNDESTENEVQQDRVHLTRGRKRGASYRGRGSPTKRGRRSTTTSTNDVGILTTQNATQLSSTQSSRFVEPAERPDANMALKFTFGVNAWRQWVITKNAELEKQSTPTRKLKLFKTDLLQLTADELNYSLCLFVKELRKPNGGEYEPDTIYYLCLGIQQFLFENNRIDNIFTDAYYEKFTDCLHEVAKKFASLYNDALYVVTRVEEEHLWECKQLGAHSPHVLLNTLMYFNTKHFNLITVEEHMQLSFSHIMKHWKRNPAAPQAAVAGKVPGSRNVLLRFYPPQSALEANSKKKKVYEQQENEDNPLRCPVKLYEFYLSKCPESVKTRNDVFYLLPERSCVPDSPVWYSTSPLAKEHLIKMLYRVKMVKEINVALLSS